LPLEQALTLAEPEGYVRLFVGEGRPMASLLTAVIERRAGWDYVRRLLAAIAEDDGTLSATVHGEPALRRSQGLVEPLSERELDVLRLPATDLDGPDIARRLFVSLHTMRTHTRSIYAKLGVNSRRAAIRRAEERASCTRPRPLTPITAEAPCALPEITAREEWRRSSPAYTTSAHPAGADW